MKRKAARILIVDEQHFLCLKIERALNQLGIYRVSPVHSIEELLCLVEYADTPFEALIINSKFSAGSGFDSLSYCLDNSQIQAALIYGNDLTAHGSVIHESKVRLCRAAFPDTCEFQWLVSATATPVKRDALRYSRCMEAWAADRCPAALLLSMHKN